MKPVMEGLTQVELLTLSDIVTNIFLGTSGFNSLVMLGSCYKVLDKNLMMTWLIGIGQWWKIYPTSDLLWEGGEMLEQYWYDSSKLKFHRWSLVAGFLLTDLNLIVWIGTSLSLHPNHTTYVWTIRGWGGVLCEERKARSEETLQTSWFKSSWQDTKGRSEG